MLFSQEGLPGLTPAGVYPRLRVSPQAWCVVRRLPALERKALKLIVTPAREAVFLTKQKPFPSVAQEVVGWLQVLDLNQKKRLLASSLEVITPLALAGGWGFQKANSGFMSEHTVPVPGRETDLLRAGVY